MIKPSVILVLAVSTLANVPAFAARACNPQVEANIKAEQAAAVAKDASDAELAIDEINAGIYVFDAHALRTALASVGRDNAQREMYLTDVVEVLYEAGHRVGSVVVEDTMEVAGVNDRAQLAVAEAELRDRINERWMRRGVTMWDPETTYIDVDVTLATDVTVAWEGNRLSVTPGAEEPFAGLDERTTFEQVRPGLFRGVEREVYIAFRKEHGEVYLCSGSGYHGTLQKLVPLDRPVVHGVAALGLMLASSS